MNVYKPAYITCTCYYNLNDANDVGINNDFMNTTAPYI